ENTIVVYGSARFREASEAQEQLVRAERSGDAREIARAQAKVRNAPNNDNAREFARIVARYSTRFAKAEQHIISTRG
ncbi:hypothetical protein, partial [Aeromicrobium sp.]|uniref:hypothetical protein n=1 Tax=Aeromicrobium sp. TaxID=1871063 RepID=UPI004033A1D9